MTLPFVFASTSYNRLRTFFRFRKTASGTLLLFTMLFDVGGVTSFRKYGHKTCHQGRCHPRFHTVISTFTSVVKWPVPTAPSTPHGGAWNQAAGLFATKTPAFTTQEGNPRSQGAFCLFSFAHAVAGRADSRRHAKTMIRRKAEVVFLEQNFKSQTISRGSRNFFNIHVTEGSKESEGSNADAFSLLRTKEL